MENLKLIIVSMIVTGYTFASYPWVWTGDIFNILKILYSFNTYFLTFYDYSKFNIHVKWHQNLLQTLLHNLDYVWTTYLMTMVHFSAKYIAEYKQCQIHYQILINAITTRFMIYRIP